MRKHIIKSLPLAIAITLAGTSCSSDKNRISEITWATFNIRYDNPQDSLNNWKYRKDNVVSFIRLDEKMVRLKENMHLFSLRKTDLKF